MKKIIITLSIVIAVINSSCKKQKDGPGEIYGKWKLAETLADPGDGSGKYIKVTGAAKYMIIGRSGKIEGEAMPDVISCKILDSVRMEIVSNSYAGTLTFRYKLTAKTLVLNPPCIEGCGMRFVRN